MPNRIKRKQSIDFIISRIRTIDNLCSDGCRYIWRSPMRCGLFGACLKTTKYGDAFRYELCLSLLDNEKSYLPIEDENKLNYKNRKV